MPKNFKNISLALPTLALAFTTLVALPVYAARPSVSADASVSASANGSAAESTHAGAQAQGSAEVSTHGQSNGQTQALKGKQLACQNRQKAITNIMTRIVSRGQNQLTLFSTIATRVEAFAVTKNVPVSVYQAQEAKLTADNTTATNDLAQMKTNTTIDCSSSNPKATVDAFKADLQQEISDLQTYRTDVKNLIVAVKTSLSSSSSSNTSSSTSSDSTTGSTGATSTTSTTTSTVKGGQQ